MTRGHFPVTFGEWLKVHRKNLDLTQDELAQRIGCSVFALRKIEAGERRPSKQMASLLASALHVHPSEHEIFLLVARGERPLERLSPDLGNSTSLSGSSVAQAVTSSSLPVPSTRLVGREPELAALHRIFHQQHCRLLTVTGPGGIGKTRLAIKYASCHQAEYPGGVFFVPLASIDSGRLVIPAIAEAVTFTFSGPANLKEQLFGFLTGQVKQPTLFILDNVEHLLESAPGDNAEQGVQDLVAEMLQLLPPIKILATSRERLHLHGEWMYELHGLSVPSDELAVEMDNYSAIELFIQCARQNKADFYQVPEQQRDILRICQFVDGIPLAIELAAAWVSVLSCAEISREIETNNDLLTTSMHDVPKRHRSIRAAFDHSWNLLNEEEQQVLQQLSVFRGGFYREAAEQVAGASLPLLASLVSKSLVRHTENGRYDLHEVIRQYAYSFLRNNPHLNDTHNRHCLFYLAILRDREKALKSGSLVETKRELQVEMENIRLAWTWAIEKQYFLPLLQAGRALGWLYETTGLHQEGIDQFELLVRKTKYSPPAPLIDRLLGVILASQSLLYFRKGDFYHALMYLEESTALLRPLKDPPAIPDPFVYLGIISHLNGDLERSRGLILEGLDHSRATGDRWFEAYSIYNLGYIASLEGQYAEAYIQMNDGMAMWRELGDPYSISLGLNYLTPTLIKLGRYKLACDGLEESIQLSTISGNRWGAGTAYQLLGVAHIALENYTEAKSLLQKSLETFSGFTTGWDVASSTIFLAQTFLLTGDLHKAQKLFADGLLFSMQASAPPPALEAILGIANILFQESQFEPALELAYFVQYHPKAYCETKENAFVLCNQTEQKVAQDQVEMIKKRSVMRSLESIVSQLSVSE